MYYLFSDFTRQWEDRYWAQFTTGLWNVDFWYRCDHDYFPDIREDDCVDYQVI